jgi:hypothetical protein
MDRTTLMVRSFSPCIGTYLLRHSEVAPGGVKKWEAEGERGDAREKAPLITATACCNRP